MNHKFIVAILIFVIVGTLLIIQHLMGFFSTYASDVSSRNSTGIEILGFPIKLELGIGEIIGPSVATIGLLLTAVIFYVGYTRTRRFEQLKLWGESWRKVDDIYYKLKEYYTSNLDGKTLSCLNETEQKKLLIPYFNLYDYLYNEVDFLVSLASEKDISRDLIKSSIKGLSEVIKDMININYLIRKDSVRNQVWTEYKKTIDPPQDIELDGSLKSLKALLMFFKKIY
jgi:predicted DNA-binding protein YlxM (UPF0122 family)